MPRGSERLSIFFVLLLATATASNVFAVFAPTDLLKNVALGSILGVWAYLWVMVGEDAWSSAMELRAKGKAWLEILGLDDF